MSPTETESPAEIESPAESESVESFLEGIRSVRERPALKDVTDVEAENWFSHYYEAWRVRDCLNYLEKRSAQIERFVAERKTGKALEIAQDYRFLAGVHDLRGLDDEDWDEWRKWCRKLAFPCADQSETAAIEERVRLLGSGSSEGSADLIEENLEWRQAAFFDFQVAMQEAEGGMASRSNGHQPYRVALASLKNALDASARLFCLNNGRTEEAETKNLLSHLTETLPRVTTRRFTEILNHQDKGEAWEWLEKEEKTGAAIDPSALAGEVGKDYWEFKKAQLEKLTKKFSSAAAEYTVNDGTNKEEFQGLADLVAVEAGLREGFMRRLPDSLSGSVGIKMSPDVNLPRTDATKSWKRIRAVSEFLELHKELVDFDDRFAGKDLDELEDAQIEKAVREVERLAEKARSLWDENFSKLEEFKGKVAPEQAQFVEDVSGRFQSYLQKREERNRRDEKRARKKKVQERKEIERGKRRASAGRWLNRRMEAARDWSSSFLEVIKWPFWLLRKLGELAIEFLSGFFAFLQRGFVYLLAAAGIIFAAIAIFGFLGGQAYEDELEALREQGNVVPLETFLAEAEEGGGLYRWLPWKPWRTTELDIQTWVKQERASEKRINDDLATLETSRQNGFAKPDQTAIEIILTRAGENNKALAPDLSGKIEPRLEEIRQAWQGHLSGEMSRLEGATLAEVESIGEKLQMLENNRQQNSFPAVRTELAALNDRLVERKGMIESGTAGVEISGEITGKLEALAAEVSGLVEAADELETKLEKFQAANDLSSWQEGLGGLEETNASLWRYLPANIQTNREKLTAAFSDRTSFQSFAFRLNDEAFSNYSRFSWKAPFPEKTSEREKELFLELRDRWELSEIAVYQGGQNDAQGMFYSRGLIKEVEQENGGTTITSGTTQAAYDTSVSPDSASFRPLRLEERRIAGVSGSTGFMPRLVRSLADECSFFNGLELQETYLARDSTAEWRKSLLYAVDEILAEDDISVLYKASLHGEIAKILLDRPESWGLEKTDFLEDLEELNSIGDSAGRLELEATSWMVPAEIQRWTPPLTAFYESKRDKSYVGQIQHLAATLGGLSTDFFTYAGHVDIDGNLKLDPGSGSADGELWGVSRSALNDQLVPSAGNISKYDFVPLSPVFRARDEFEAFRVRVGEDPILKKSLGHILK